MKLALIGSMAIIGAALANDIEIRAQAFDPAPQLCQEGERGETRNRRYFMEEVESEPRVDYSMLAVAPRDDRHYFIQSPPLPDLRERLCDLEWLDDFVPHGPMERFDFER